MTFRPLTTPPVRLRTLFVWNERPMTGVYPDCANCGRSRDGQHCTVDGTCLTHDNCATATDLERYYPS